MPDVVVRPVCDDDEPALRRLAGETTIVAEAAPPEPSRDVVFVAEVEGHHAGYLAVREEGRVLVIDQIVVAPADQGRHVGHRLLDWAEGYGTSRGLERVRVPAAGADWRAQEFYRSRGYAAAGRAFERELVHL